MIDFTINKIEMYDEDEFTLHFSTQCDKCNISSGQTIKGPKMTRILVTCPSCNEKKHIDIIPEIYNTVREKWNYDQEAVDSVMKKLEKFRKTDS